MAQPNLENFIAQHAQQHQQVISRLDAMQARIDALEASQQRLPLLLDNTAASLDAPIRYPQGVQITPQFPKNKIHLLQLSGRLVADALELTFTRLAAADAQVVAQRLGLQALPHNATEEERLPLPFPLPLLLARPPLVPLNLCVNIPKVRPKRGHSKDNSHFLLPHSPPPTHLGPLSILTPLARPCKRWCLVDYIVSNVVTIRRLTYDTKVV
ncbi:hypothetical protein EDB85DRAFT_1890995 [Lactarius pseudohatsudake]|nr:hypothetical protein EDB85DRAFT_1890995 [Lactarius pseudohatsudake]